jgi:histidyl-tRNA synthetase
MNVLSNVNKLRKKRKNMQTLKEEHYRLQSHYRHDVKKKGRKRNIGQNEFGLPVP